MKSQAVACCVLLGATLVIAGPLLGVQRQPRPDGAAHHIVGHGSSPQNQDVESEGRRVFEQNCARCHNAPEGFPPSITGTIVRHMRVRANLSRHDEQVLLRYFNP